MVSKNILDYCSFCYEFNGSYDESFFYNNIGIAYELTNRVLFSTEHWVVVPAIGSLVPGYMLIISKKHFFSVLDCPENYFEELESLLNKLTAIIQKVYRKKYILFEHGSLDCHIKGGSCVTHAHIHLVPFDKDLLHDINVDLFKDRCFNNFHDIQSEYKGKKQYLFYQENTGKRHIFESEVIPSQFFRQLLAKESGIPDKWDWRQNFGTDMILKTLSDINRFKQDNNLINI